MLVRRRLDEHKSGSGAYLLEFLRCLRLAGYKIRIVCAPCEAFGSIPFLHIDPKFLEAVDDVVWPGTVKIGPWYVSVDRRAWLRSARRASDIVVDRVLYGKKTHKNRLGTPLIACEASVLASAVNALDDDLVVAEYSSLAPVLELIKAPRRAVLLHDLFSARAQAFRDAGMAPDHSELSLETEADQMRAANLCIHASVEELDLLKGALPQAMHIWQKPALRRKALSTPEPGPRVVFIGVTHGGNADAMERLLADIWPKVIAEEPSARLQIIGEIGALIERRHEGVEVLGHVPDLRTYGGPDAIGIAPTRIASGASIKVATYLELGMTVVADPSALKGFGDLLNDTVEIAETDEAFAKALVELIRDPVRRKELAEKADRAFDDRLANCPLVEALAGRNTCRSQKQGVLTSTG
ncbi:MAG: glycosyltransferase family 4 protein [Pseudomonadota bacterium]